MDAPTDVDRTQEEYLISSTKIIDQMRHDDQFTNVVLKCGEASFPAHAIVLAANSAYFRELLTSSKTHSLKRHIWLDATDVQVIEILLTFMYTGYLELSENLSCTRQLMVTAKQFRLPDFDKHLAMALRHVISPKDFAIFWQLASESGNSDLEAEVINYVVKNFVDLYKTTEFRELPLTYIRRIYPRLLRCNISAEIMLSSVLLWVRSLEPSLDRAKKIPTLLRFIKLNQLSPEFCSYLLLNEPILSHFPRLWKYLNHVQKHHDLKLSEILRLKKQSPPASVTDDYRLKYTTVTHWNSRPDEKENILGEGEFNVKGIDGREMKLGPSNFVTEWLKNVNDVSFYAPTLYKNLWETSLQVNNGSEKLKKLPDLISGVRLFGRVILVLGKVPQKGFLFQFFSLQQYAWVTTESPLDALHKGSCHVPNGAVTVTVDNMLYVIGGTDGISNESTSSVIIYSIHENTFRKETTKMKEARSLAGATISSGSIYIIGGLLVRQNLKATPLKSAERYIISKNTWQPLASLPIALWLLAVTSSEGFLFCFGGLDDMGYSKRCFAYNHRINEWTMVTQMPNSFDNSLCLSASLQNKMYAFRCTNKTNHNSVCLYDRRRDIWVSLKTSGNPPKDTVLVLPWRTRIFVLDQSGRIYPFNIMTSQWEQESAPFVEHMVPMYAAILQRV